MAKGILGTILSLPASGDLSALQFHAMTVNASGQAAQTGAAARNTGFLQNKPDAAGKAASVQLDGRSKAVAGAAVTAGAFLEVNASGRVVTLAAGVAVGQALESASADGDLISIVILQG